MYIYTYKTCSCTSIYDGDERMYMIYDGYDILAAKMYAYLHIYTCVYIYTYITYISAFDLETIIRIPTNPHPNS